MFGIEAGSLALLACNLHFVQPQVLEQAREVLTENFRSHGIYATSRPESSAPPDASGRFGQERGFALR